MTVKPKVLVFVDGQNLLRAEQGKLRDRIRRHMEDRGYNVIRSVIALPGKGLEYLEWAIGEAAQHDAIIATPNLWHVQGAPGRVLRACGGLFLVDNDHLMTKGDPVPPAPRIVHFAGGA